MKPYTKTPIRGLDNLAWRQLRQTGIGGSDAPHLVLTLEEYRYANPEKLLRDKVEPLGEEVVSLPCQCGHALESVVAERYTMATGNQVHKVNFMLRSVEHPFMCANIDRKLCGIDEGLECKTINWKRSRKTLYDPETGQKCWIDKFATGDPEIDMSYMKEWYIQMQHYMAVTGWKMWHLGVIIECNRFVYYDVPRDDALIEQLIAAEAGFWGAVLDARAEFERSI